MIRRIEQSLLGLWLAGTTALSTWASPFDGSPSAARPGLGGLTPFADMLISLQRGLNRFLGQSLGALADGFDAATLGMALLVSIGYGLVHALSPGHGKTVLLAYGLKNEDLGAQIILAPALGAILHVLSALFWSTVFLVLMQSALKLDRAGVAAALLIFASVILLANGTKDVVQLIRNRNAHHHDWVWVAISIGLVPCPISTLIFTAAIQYEVPFYGLLLCLVFGIGLAITLTTFGLLPVLARKPFSRFLSSPRSALVMRWIPLVSALAFIALGLAGIFQVIQTN